MKFRTLLAAAAALAAAAPLSAQTDPAAPAAPAPAPAPAAAPADSITIIQQRLAALQQQAQQDAAVQAASKQFEADLFAAMARLDAAATEKKARSEALMAEVEAARTAGDNAKLNQLAAEAQQLQAYFNGLRSRAMQEADVQEKRKAFLGVLFGKMTEIDPQAQALVERLGQLKAAANSQR
ncbi:MAG TPA: hypothetical protein VFQ45_17945 [Longimicrobium sp.]|nr:hypothetical protein [Longimicrobium sp.]